ncbi:piRNA biogenesis protein EXD1 [Polymixia lowei]
MTADNLQFVDIIKNKRVKLTLKTASYFGIVQRINHNKTVVLADVVDVKTGRKFPGVKMFFGHEILNGEFIDVRWPKKAKQMLNFLVKQRVTMDDEDDEENVNFEVIDEFHEKFGPAVMHIKKQQVVGIAADGVAPFLHRRLCWLQIATKNKVYLFDILLLGAQAFKNGLAMILESKRTLKVIHDCRGIAGCLMAQFGVKLTNVFDTQVADVMCFYSETGGFLPDRVSTLQEVVSLHLKVPSSQLSSLQMKTELTKEEGEMWYKRPCPMPLLKVMALSVIHLQPLRLVLLDGLMTDYMSLVDSYLSNSHDEPGKVEHIGMRSALELPGELKELEHMRRELQQCAVDRYPVTEQGLLDRFNPKPHPKPPSQASPAAEEQIQDPVPETQPESPDPAQVCPFYHQPSTNDPLVADVSSVQSTALAPVAVCPAPVPAAQVPIPALLPDLRKQLSVNSPASPGGSPAAAQTAVDTMGRGGPLGENRKPPLPAFPSMGRGFLLHIPLTQVAEENTGATKTPGPKSSPAQEAMAQPGPNANALLGDIPGLGGGRSHLPHQPYTSILNLSFSSFRNT